MTATSELRALLDERGIEWDYGITGAASTKFNVNGVDVTFVSSRDGLVCSTILTPEQVIEATLGYDEECEPVVTDCYDGLLPPFTVHCSACGEEWGFTPRFCPNCRRRVKQ